MFGERPGHTLQTTALLNEAYLKLVNSRHVNWQNRAHFFAISAQLMRRILVDYARARGYQKRGGGVPKVTLDEALMGQQEKGHALVALDDALKTLAGVDPRKCKVVEGRGEWKWGLIVGKNSSNCITGRLSAMKTSELPICAKSAREMMPCGGRLNRFFSMKKEKRVF
jgi:hypothetical protein